MTPISRKAAWENDKRETFGAIYYLECDATTETNAVESKKKRRVRQLRKTARGIDVEQEAG